MFKVGDSNDLSNKIQELAFSKELRTFLGNNARKTVCEKYDIKDMVKKYEEVYHKIISQ